MSAECDTLGEDFGKAIRGFDAYYVYGKCWGLETPSESKRMHKAAWLNILKDDGPNCDWGKPMDDYFNDKTI